MRDRPELAAPEEPSQLRPGPSPVEWAGFLLRCAARRWWVAVLVFALGIGATAAYYRTLAPLYRAEARLLANRQQSLPSAARAAMADDPTRSAADLIHRRENLLALARQVGLLPPALASPARGGNPTASDLPPPAAIEDELLSSVVLRLHRALEVTTADGVISIAVYWPNPQQAYELVDGALQNFLEARHIQEVTAIDEMLAVLLGRVEIARENLDKAIAEREQERERGRASTASPARSARPTEETIRLKALLDAKHRAIQDVEDFRRRRLLDLQAQLEAMRGVYSEAHPDFIRLRQDVEGLARESPQMAVLREEERKLRAQLSEATARSERAGDARPRSLAERPGEDDPAVRDARSQYQQMLGRVEATQVELDTARAAFKYRYNIVWPPQIPREPVSPNPKKLFGAGGLASLLLALLAAAGLDLASGRVRERWQIERMLDVPVIAQLGPGKRDR